MREDEERERRGRGWYMNVGLRGEICAEWTKALLDLFAHFTQFIRKKCNL